MKVQFLGATRQVTGSRYLLEAAGLRLLVDCGLFQERHYLSRNWDPCPVPPDSIDYLLLTHAHLDHSGLIPRLVREGFRRPILTTAASRDLAEIILTDSANIQEEDAFFKQKRHRRENRTGPYPVQPLYTHDDALAVLPLFQMTPYNRPVPLNDHVAVTFRDAGHILGSAMLEVAIRANGDSSTLIFSGDIGEWDKPIIRDPTLFQHADYVVMESTYGAREHEMDRPIEDQLCDVINTTVSAGGNVVIPTFAVERAQELMYYIGRLVRADRIPHLLVFLDSPMAVDVTDVFRRHRECMDAEALALIDSGEPPCRFPGLQLVQTVAQSKAINRIKGSCIVMAGAGMCNAGRIKHHLVNNIGRRACTVLFVGYQAVGTLGRQLVDGAKSVRIHGTKHRVRARIAQLHGLSGHAGRSSLLKWIGSLQSSPRRIFLTHGEPDAASSLADAIRAHWNCPIDIPDYLDEAYLD